MTVKYFLYNTLLKTAVIILSPFFLYKLLTQKKHRAGFLQKLGFYKNPQKTQSIWFHAVSVGEVLAAVPLIKKTQKHHHGYRIVVSTVTMTGNRVAKKMVPEVDEILYFPFDLKFSVARAIRAVNPALCLILETELWPNYIHQLYKKKIPIIIVNGRISSRSFKRYTFFSEFMKTLFKQVTLFGMQSEEDAKRVISLGSSPEKVLVCGNLKYDREVPTFNPDDLLSIKNSVGFSNGAPLLVAGSTHPGEEGIIIEVYTNLLKTHPELGLLIAPRHPEKANVVIHALKKAGLTPLRKTTLQGKRVSPLKKEVLILDTIGELARVFAISDIVFVGGSLVPHGGQNILEPASYRKPVLFGKYMDNFSEISRHMVEAGAGVCVQNKEELYSHIDDLLHHPEKIEMMGQKGFELIHKNRGALKKCLGLIERGLLHAKQH
ncbi:MAG: 3-deoxy-D-manno-octulosonic acid transferase [Nitrospinota bacterium]